jgi:hypothetical protein
VLNGDGLPGVYENLNYPSHVVLGDPLFSEKVESVLGHFGFDVVFVVPVDIHGFVVQKLHIMDFDGIEIQMADQARQVDESGAVFNLFHA